MSLTQFHFSGIVTQFGKDFRRAFIAFVLEDMRARCDIIIAWLYREYVLEQGTCKNTVMIGYQRSGD